MTQHIDSSLYQMITTYFPIISAISAMIIAQTLKCIIFKLQGKKVTLKLFLQPGGMPSTHAAAVIGLTTALAMIDGLHSHTFMISIIFSFIVLYDASGVRYTAGIHGRILNELTDKKHDLSELLGHTPMEVAAGTIIGLLTPFGLNMLLLSV